MGLLNGQISSIITSAMSGIFLDAVLTRDIPGTITDPADPPSPTPTTFSCKAIRENYGVGYRSGGLVRTEDVKVIILQGTLSTTPRALDRITITGMGGPFTIVSDNQGQPAVTADPANATWECRARN